MKRIFTLFIIFLAFAGTRSFAQANPGTGIAWGSEFFPSSGLVLDEDFQDFEFFHSDSTADMGNSNNVYANDGVSIIYGYKNDSLEVPVIGSDSKTIKYTFKQCAFAPDWKTAWAFRDDVENTPNVSDGFVEVSRDYESDPPTVAGYFEVDLSALEYVDGIQYSHSSCGGNKRGFLLMYSIDDGTSWDTLRFQGSSGTTGFTKDITSGAKTENSFNCEPSAYGMTWEEGLYYVGNLKLRFMATTQVPRIHDLKVYGDLPTAAQKISKDELKIYSFNKKIRISEPSDIAVYSITGNLIKMARNTQLVSMDEAPTGIYIVKANMGSRVNMKKIVIQ